MRPIDAENIPTKFINFGMPTVICGIEVPDIDSAPTLSPDDVRGVGHGRWEKNHPDDNIFYCNQCAVPNDTLTNYCPSCGAKMEVSEDA